MGRHSARRTAAAPAPAGEPRRPMPFPRSEAQAPAAKPRRSGRGIARLSLTLVLLAIGFIAAAGISFVISPSWGGGAGATADNGHIPNRSGIRQPTRIAAIATRDIVPGEELTISYVSPSMPVEQRRQALLEDYAFGPCACARCEAESAE